jgi:hypothetical protein
VRKVVRALAPRGNRHPRRRRRKKGREKRGEVEVMNCDEEDDDGVQKSCW